MRKETKVNCEVENCKYNKSRCCNLDELDISCTCDNEDCHDQDETICKSFEECDDNDDNCNEFEYDEIDNDEMIVDAYVELEDDE